MSKHQKSGFVINKTAQKRSLESDENPEPKNKKSKKSVITNSQYLEHVQDNHQNNEISNQLNKDENPIYAINEPIVFIYDTNLINFDINHSNWLNQIQLSKENSIDVSIDYSNSLSNESSDSYLNNETQSYSNNNRYQFSSAPNFNFSVSPNFNINLEKGFIS